MGGAPARASDHRPRSVRGVGPFEKGAPLRYIAPTRMRPIARFAWAALAYDVAVVAWGAYVRASGSGAGCGRHWPLCNGEAIPRAPQTATLIELSHRLSSGGTL